MAQEHIGARSVLTVGLERMFEVRATESTPLPDEVREIVEELRTDNCQCLDAYKRRGRVDPQCQSCDTKDERNRAADLIERLAKQVPEGCVVVPKKPTEAMLDAVLDERLNALMDSRPHTLVDIYKAMIAAGEVKP